MENLADKAFEASVNTINFFSFGLSDCLRDTLDEGDSPDNYYHTALAYDRSYGEINIIVEVMDDLLYWAYLKDYNFGHMKPLGECIYDYKIPGAPKMPESYKGEEYIPGWWSHFGENDMDGTSWSAEDNHPRDEEYETAYHKAYSDWTMSTSYRDRVNEAIMPDLARRILSGEINICQELHDYYHIIPDEKIPTIKNRMSELVSVQEAAETLAVTASRVKKMVADGVLDGFKHDGKLYLSKQGVEARKKYIERYGKPTRGKAKKGGVTL